MIEVLVLFFTKVLVFCFGKKNIYLDVHGYLALPWDQVDHTDKQTRLSFLEVIKHM
jgi:hypothetical protein